MKSDYLILLFAGLLAPAHFAASKSTATVGSMHPPAPFGASPLDVLGILILILLVLFVVAAIWLRKHPTFDGFCWPIQVPWVLLGVTGAVMHAYDKRLINDPNADLITLAWAGFAALGGLIHNIDEFPFPGGGAIKWKKKQAAISSVNIPELLGRVTQFTELAENAVGVSIKLGNLVDNWTSSAGALDARLQRKETPDDDVRGEVTRFCRERMEEALDLIRPQNERARISLWWSDESRGGLTFLMSNEISDPETTSKVWTNDEGLIGHAFLEADTVQYDDAPKHIYYVPVRKEAPAYHGLLMVPVKFLNEPLGILSIDREGVGYFEDLSVQIAQSLAETLSQALTHPRTRSVFKILPDSLDSRLIGLSPPPET